MPRPKGSKNIKTEQWDKFSDWFMSTGITRFKKEMEKLEGKDLVITMKDLFEYFQPKLARTETKHSGQVEVKQAILDDTYGQINHKPGKASKNPPKSLQKPS